MTDAGLIHDVMKPVSELEDRYSKAWSAEGPTECVMRLAGLKALAVARILPRQDAVVIGADTIADWQGQILGKPQDRGDAFRMLKELSGDVHEVITGFALIFLDSGRLVTKAVRTTVVLNSVEDQVLADYIAAGLADGKAGSYGIQDALIGPLVKEVRGPFDNVVGLPVKILKETLMAHGVRL
jgi:septum formation protein